MISYYKQQEQIGERQRAEMKANAGKPVKFDFRSAEQCRIDSAKEKKEIRITFHQRGHVVLFNEVVDLFSSNFHA